MSLPSCVPPGLFLLDLCVHLCFPFETPFAFKKVSHNICNSTLCSNCCIYMRHIQILVNLNLVRWHVSLILVVCWDLTWKGNKWGLILQLLCKKGKRKRHFCHLSVARGFAVRLWFRSALPMKELWGWWKCSKTRLWWWWLKCINLLKFIKFLKISKFYCMQIMPQ